MKRWIHHYVVAAAVFGGIGSVNAQVVEKVADLDFVAHVDGYGVGGYAPLDRFTLYGTSLWYTTSRGGSNDAGTVSTMSCSISGASGKAASQAARTWAR